MLSKSITYVNPLSLSDSYKVTQPGLFSTGDGSKLVHLEACIEPRVDKNHPDDLILVFGLSEISKLISEMIVTKENIQEFSDLSALHFMNPSIFDPTPWNYVVDNLGGKIPLIIEGLPEGSIVRRGTPICKIISTIPECATFVSYFEGFIQSHLWYLSTVASRSLEYSRVIKEFLLLTEGSSASLPFKHQDFGFRAGTSFLSSILAGMAHLLVSKGSDTISSVLEWWKRNGRAGEISGYSVIAFEHNQIISMGPDFEFLIIKNALDIHPSGIISVLCDTFDSVANVNEISRRPCTVSYVEHFHRFDDDYAVYLDKMKKQTGLFKQISQRPEGSTYVIRPDSKIVYNGVKLSVSQTVLKILEILQFNLGELITTNALGYKLLPSYFRIIYGDGLNVNDVRQILTSMYQNGWSADNIVFGTGGNLYQTDVTRSTYDFSMKCYLSKFEKDGVIRTYNIKKITPGKESKSGPFIVGKLPNCEFVYEPLTDDNKEHDQFVTYYNNGQVLCYEDLFTIRKRVEEFRETNNI
uniref:Nicotinamide phosphoribosyltransferase n=1 Tax=viral metagenome TaxID=1070528 RepID=A0A6C0BD90_9ZZZZ